jgi:hypothetical protein
LGRLYLERVWEIRDLRSALRSQLADRHSGWRWQVAGIDTRGVSPRWNGNGKELFYVALDGTVMSVEVDGSNGVFQSGIPKPLFKPKGVTQQSNDLAYWDASSDGKKFIFAASSSASATAPPPRFTVVLNWQAGLKK